MSNDQISINKQKTETSLYSSKRKKMNSSWGNLLKNYAKTLSSKDYLFCNSTAEKEEIEQTQNYSSSVNGFFLN